MSRRITISQKFQYFKKVYLLDIIERNGFKETKMEYQTDEYFSDINSNCIKNNTCLIVRRIDNKFLKLIFQENLKKNDNNCVKFENNIDLKIDDYNSVIDFIYSLGYVSYSVVNKKRIVYTKRIGDCEYNVILDQIDVVDNFIKVEIVCYELDEKINCLFNKLNDFIKMFGKLELKRISFSYGDFISNKLCSNIVSNKKMSTILFDLDGTLIDSEKIFFESFRDVIFARYNYSISYNEYYENELKQNANLIINLKSKGIIAKNEKSETIMNDVYLEYEKKFIDLLDERVITSNFELLKQLKNKGLKLALVSTSRRKFINILLNKLDIKDLFEVVISREDAVNLKPSPDAYIMALNLLKITSDNCIALEDSERGIKSSKDACIKTIQVNDFTHNKISTTEISERLSRILLAIINFTIN